MVHALGAALCAGELPPACTLRFTARAKPRLCPLDSTTPTPAPAKHDCDTAPRLQLAHAAVQPVTDVLGPPAAALGQALSGKQATQPPSCQSLACA